MTPEQFCYWLQGYLEVSGASEIGEAQLQVIEDHLSTVFTKVTPVYKPNSLTPIPYCSPGTQSIC